MSPPALSIVDSDISTLLLGGVLLLATVAGTSFVLRLRHLRRDLSEARQAREEAERRCSEAELLLAAEPHAMIVWNGYERTPEKIFSHLPEVRGVPEDPARLTDYRSWLQPDSADRLIRHLDVLRRDGKAFNIAISPLRGDLLEADGRVAGSRAILRIRPVFGERRDALRMTTATRDCERRLDRLAGLLDTAPVPVWVEEEGRLAWANESYRRAVEAESIDEVVETDLRLVNPEEMHPATEDPTPDDETQASPFRRFRAVTVIAGARRLLDITEAPHEAGRVFWAFDVTEVENLRAELRHHLDTQASTLDRLTTAIAIFGRDQRLEYFNPAFARLWGLDAQFLERHPTEGEILDRLHDLGRLQQHADFRGWKAARAALYTSTEGSDERWHLPDGRTIRVVTEPHVQGGVLCIYDDITEKLRLESRFKELMEAYRETLDNLHEGIALFGPDGRLRLHNPAFADMWKLEAEDLAPGPHITEIIERCRPLLDEAAWWDRIRYCVTGMADRRAALSSRITLADGRVFDHALVPLPDGNTLLSWVDMTAAAEAERNLREKNEALMEADRLKSAVLASISYHLRNPLNAIIGFGDALNMGMAGELNERQKEYLRYIRTSSSDLLSVIDTIIDLATIDAGRMELKIEPVDVAEVLEEVARRMADRLEARDLMLKVDIADDAGTIMADRGRLLQILSQLLSNAIGFSDTGRTVHMGARRGAGGTELWVADEGPGMDPEFQKSVFERFTARPSSDGHRGPGLGLPLVKSLVELHGGSVELVSRIGQGTTVVCRFPDVADDADRDDRHPEAAA